MQLSILTLSTSTIAALLASVAHPLPVNSVSSLIWTCYRQTFSGGGSGVDLCDAYRKTVLLYLVAFKPDIIFISAGFDAHKVTI